MGISLKTHKVLWGRSGGKCAICKADLTVEPEDSSDGTSVVGDEAHIIAREESFTRGNYDSLSPEERDEYSNLILLCKNDHKRVDDQPNHFTVERLREIKATHEQEVRSHWTDEDANRQNDDILYAGYIDEWDKRADLANWQITASEVNSDTPYLPRKWYRDQKDFQVWIISRIWPRRYVRLEYGFHNYMAVLQDFLLVFDRHIDPRSEEQDLLRTEKFYHIPEWDELRYNKLLAQWERHQGVVCDLFFELTRAANYVCDLARETIFPGYRLKEGALLVVRTLVGWDLRTEFLRPEYRGKERTRRPYPGLKKFMKLRYSRDYAISPDPTPPPTKDAEDV